MSNTDNKIIRDSEQRRNRRTLESSSRSSEKGGEEGSASTGASTSRKGQTREGKRVGGRGGDCTRSESRAGSTTQRYSHLLGLDVDSHGIDHLADGDQLNALGKHDPAHPDHGLFDMRFFVCLDVNISLRGVESMDQKSEEKDEGQEKER